MSCAVAPAIDPWVDVLDNTRRFLRAFRVETLSPAEEWQLVEGLMGHVRGLLHLKVPAHEIVARLRSDLAEELANVGVSPTDVESIVASAANGKLVGPVAIAWANREEADRQAKAEPASEPNAEGDELPDLAALRAAAAPALHHPRPLELFAESCREMGLGGDLALAKIVYLAATTRVLPRRTGLHAHLYVLGPASSGKSHEADAGLAHLPDEAVVRFEGASPRALIYSTRDIQHKALVYAEMDSLPSASEDDAASAALSFLRTLVVNGVASYDVTVKTKDGFTTRRYTKEGPTTLIVTGTKRLTDEQLASRLHEVEVTVDRERLRSVIDAQGALLSGRHAQAAASKPIVSLQVYLQALAPIDVVIPFAAVLGRAILEAARVTDPRLTREFPRIAGFTAAHALLSIDRRERSGEGAVVATLEDYEAARAVVRELSTIREFGQFAIQVWETIVSIHKDTANSVTVSQVSKRLLKAHRHVSRQFSALLQGGALVDAPERPSKTAPHLVVPSSETPCRILLPTSDDLIAGGFSPREPVSKQAQVNTAQCVHLDSQARSLGVQANSLKGSNLPSLGHETAGGNGPSPAEPATPRPDGRVYKVGDRLPDGRIVTDVDELGRLAAVRQPRFDEVRL